MFGLALLIWVTTVHFVASSSMMSLTINAFSDCLASGALFLVLYLALEPALRLRWPHSIITWNRVLAGRWSDPQVGSHILIGLAMGTAMLLFQMARDEFYKNAEGLDTFGGLYLLNGTRYWIAGMFSRLIEGINTGLIFFFAVFGLRQLLRRDWIAAIVGGILFSLVQGDLVNAANWQAELAVFVVIITALVFALLRFGLVVAIAAVFALNTLNGVTLGTDWNAWYAPAGFATVVLVFAITALAFRSTLGDRELL
jgi:serine/threonine-protein kinase